MDEKLDKIVKNTASKASFLITLTGQGSKLEKSFVPEIAVTAGCHYEIAFASLETYNSIPNINESNNTIQISKLKMPWVPISLDTGCYGLMDLNIEIGRKIKALGMDKAVEFKANYNTFRCIMYIRPGFAVNFSGGRSMNTVLGFEKKIYKTKDQRVRYVSEHIVRIMMVNSILVHCDLVGASYLNGVRVPVIHSFFPLADPGDKIVERPTEYIYLPISSDVIRHMSVWLTDQDQNLLDLREETLTIKFHLRSC